MVMLTDFETQTAKGKRLGKSTAEILMQTYLSMLEQTLTSASKKKRNTRNLKLGGFTKLAGIRKQKSLTNLAIAKFHFIESPEFAPTWEMTTWRLSSRVVNIARKQHAQHLWKTRPSGEFHDASAATTHCTNFSCFPATIRNKFFTLRTARRKVLFLKFLNI
jgi:hypothetical protein